MLDNLAQFYKENEDFYTHRNRILKLFPETDIEEDIHRNRETETDRDRENGGMTGL